MITLSLQQIADIVNACLIGENGEIHSVSTDTREIEPGALFIALVGDRFDGHQFCQKAQESGACAVLVENQQDVAISQLVVDDTRIALGKLAAWVHQQCAIKTVAITGSCGKTTVKEMTAAILGLKGKVLATQGNFNNDIGVPLTLLRSEPEHDYAVIELGANHIGEIAYTTQLVQPDVALVNNVAAAHLEGFGSVEGVKKAKGEIYQGLKSTGVAVINSDSQGGHLWASALIDKLVVTFSALNENADIYASDVELDADGKASFILHSPVGTIRIKLSVVGQHNVANALAAAALTLQFGCSLSEIQSGLASVINMKGRVTTEMLSDTIRLIDDSYNASVPAMQAAVDLLSTYSGVKWLILGYMAELGSESLALHRQLGDYAAQFHFDYVLTYGKETQVISEVCGGKHFSSHDDMIQFIRETIKTHYQKTHTLLVKGANSARMSVVVDALKEKHK